jgi:hypothetical protein
MTTLEDRIDELIQELRDEIGVRACLNKPVAITVGRLLALSDVKTMIRKTSESLGT